MHHRGFTLAELALTLTVIALLATVAVPRVAGLVASVALRGARADLLAGLDAARMAAVRQGVTVALRAGPGVLVVEGVGADTNRYWAGPHPARRGVGATGLSAPIHFADDGLATGVSNRTIRLTLAGRERRVVVSRLGRVR